MKPKLESLIRSLHATPAQALFRSLNSAGWVRTRKEFADLVEVDAGNIYNYLANETLPRRIPAKTDTLRRWGQTIERRTDGRVRVKVWENADGEVEMLIEGVDAAGVAIHPVRVAESARENHRRGSDAGRRACDDLLAALRSLLPEATRRCSARCCAFRIGPEVLRVEHQRGEVAVRASIVGPGRRASDTRSALAAAAIPVLDAPARRGRRGDPTPTVMVGEGHVAPERLTREVARMYGWAPVDVRLAEEVGDDFWEGGRSVVMVNSYERDRTAREACLAHHTARCKGCGMTYFERYGIGAGFMHVHHIHPLHDVDGPYRVDPLRHLVPLCANCHAMAHWNTRVPRTVEELRRLIEQQELKSRPHRPELQSPEEE